MAVCRTGSGGIEAGNATSADAGADAASADSDSVFVGVELAMDDPAGRPSCKRKPRGALGAK